MNEFRVTAQRSGGWWALEVEGPGLRRSAHTQVRRLDQVEETVRDLLALRFDVDVDGRLAATWKITVVPVLGDELAAEVAHTRELRREADRLRDDAVSHSREAARHLREQGLPHRDIGALLGVSHQAVSKLLAG
ncbi:hypothetical protein [Streptosporangium roseum]|uniref:hypothetical protein n=1 Tax=Streptosporangium roseum TaxID=2001 RepID=UPI0004CDD5DB|nr:hypothetical protein [Streptosporangium roseum]